MKHATTMVALVILAVPCAARPQGLEVPENDAWGTRWTTTQTIGAWAFVGPMTDGGNGYRDCAPATGACRAALDLPSGMAIHTFEVEACDSSPNAEVVADLWACGPAPGPGACAIVAEVRSGIAAALGCVRYRADVIPNLTVNNYNFTYFVDVFGTTGTANVPARFRGVRTAMVRQVSPAPAAPTFGDVPPSHPYFRHIEALAGALISGGCGGGLYCPDRALTRGEAAVLLAEALGLHFPD